MHNLDDLVLDTVREFVRNGEMFTALDVSNKVKQTMPHARHREVRDVVRNVFSSEIESNGYARTPISVTLADGTTAEALLYHLLSDSWDLDAKYDAQKRAAVSNHVASQPVVQAAVAPVMPVVAPTPSAPATPHDLWNKLFQTQPSLFSRKGNP